MYIMSQLIEGEDGVRCRRLGADGLRGTEMPDPQTESTSAAF